MIHHLQKLTATGEELYAKVCTVHRVDTENNYCDVIPVDGTAELFDVSFQADSQGGGLCFYPAVNSNVLVVFINKHHACICNVSEVDLMKLVIDKMEFSVDKDGLSLKNGDVEFLVNQSGFLLKKKDETLKKLMTELLDAIQAMVFTTSQGPTTLLQNASTFKTIQTRFNTLLKD
jgi:hypothetical protein